MAARVVYQAHDGDGYQPGYVELLVDSANDLTGRKIAAGEQEVTPAPGSIAYTPGVTSLWHCKSDGAWEEFS